MQTPRQAIELDSGYTCATSLLFDTQKLLRAIQKDGFMLKRQTYQLLRAAFDKGEILSENPLPNYILVKRYQICPICATRS
jgi:hypothetical protein